MKLVKALVIGGATIALAVPAGVAAAAVGSPGPRADTSTSTTPGPGYGPRAGMQGAGIGDPADCPYYNSAEHQQWMQDREARQEQMRQLHGDDWTPPRDGTGPFHGQAPGPRAGAVQS